MSERLYYQDSYLQQFSAHITGTSDAGLVYLDRTAFYPTSGGQPHDRGTLSGIEVLEVIDEGERIAHRLAGPLAADQAEGRIDWVRRFDHMQQHTGQHLLSAVLVELFGAETVGFHLGTEAAAIDVTGTLSESQLAEAELRANQIVCENRAVSIAFEDAATAQGLRKASDREGTLRIIRIEGLDRSACGGTHVRATGEIGPILLRKLDRAHGNLRIEFLCGLRAVRRARTDFQALSQVARTLSSAIDEAPAIAAAQAQALQESEKTRRKVSAELAVLLGRELYAAAEPDANGLRVIDERVAALDDDTRSRAQGCTSGAKAVYIAASAQAVMLAASKDSGIHAGNVLKEALTAAGGRGGGSPLMAQGSVPAGSEAAALVQAIRNVISR